jgi:hypothetical protein
VDGKVTSHYEEGTIIDAVCKQRAESDVGHKIN